MSARLVFFLLSMFFTLTINAKDNVTIVSKLYTTSKYYDLQMPVMVDSSDVKGQKFDKKDLLNSYISLPKKSEYNEFVDADVYDFFEVPKAPKDARIYLLSFDMSSDAFSETILKIKSASMFQVFINGIKEVEKTSVEDSISEAKVANLDFSVLPPTIYNIVIKYISFASNLAPEKIKITLQPKYSKRKTDYNLTHTPRRNITIKDILLGKRVSSAKISSDGNHVLLEYKTTLNDGKSFTEKELLSLKTNRRVKLSANINYAWMPASPKLYYIEKNGNNSNLISIHPETQEENVMAYDIPYGVCRFTPDEKMLLYVDDEKFKYDKSNLVRLSSPESVQPGNLDRKFISIYSLSTGIKNRLTFGDKTTTIDDVSTDSRYLLCSVRDYDPTVRPFFFRSLYRIDLKSFEIDTLFEKQGFVGSSFFSPDGNKILIEGSGEAFDGIGNILSANEIPNGYNKMAFLMDIDTREIEAISKNFVPSIDQSYWSKYDGMIYFVCTDMDYVRVYRYNVKSKKYTRLSLSEDVVTGFDLAKNSSKAVYTGVGVTNFTKAYTIDLNGENSFPIADPQKSIVDDLTLSRVNDWNFESSGGSTVYGRYYLPPNFDASKKYPLIVYFYGGTIPTHRTLEATYPLQVYAALGYVVYVLQPSGAIGFGQEFAARHVNGWGKQNADDIIRGTQLFVKEHPFVDEKKIGCMGASYGGYMSMYLQTQTDLFAAAVSHAGISSISSYWGEGFWGYTYSSIASAGSYPWNNEELYVKQSPIFNADKINTPMLLLHGTEDTNVPMGESIQMFTALKILGKPVDFIQIKGENHGVRDLKKRLDWNLTIQAWLAKWLQDDPDWWNSMYPSIR